ncbi:hypothetical protein CEXT_95191 [Caerostris extrusa]|uniref:Uncharacterized protein n=1 Tax=Caerostris extrusa TaxID=172846 RepID=A0AAV4PDM2_CAEEX|nr:hypothetical protein CEXT_95191 [Caerostris extrusa]
MHHVISDRLNSQFGVHRCLVFATEVRPYLNTVCQIRPLTSVSRALLPCKEETFQESEKRPIDPESLRGRELLTIDLRVLGLRVTLGQPRLGAVSGARLGAAQVPEELPRPAFFFSPGHFSEKENKNL